MTNRKKITVTATVTGEVGVEQLIKSLRNTHCTPRKLTRKWHKNTTEFNYRIIHCRAILNGFHFATVFRKVPYDFHLRAGSGVNANCPPPPHSSIGQT